MPPVGHTTFGYRSVVSATVQDIYKDRLQVVTLPVPVRILRDAYHDRLIFPEKGWRLPDKWENTGPPEQGVTCYCFGLLLTTSGAVVGIFGRGAKGVISPCP